MFKVLIADDEFRVCKVIRKLINWEQLDLELVGIAETGIDEYAMIEQYRPDIVITDIRMPGQDGLQVIEKVKKNGWHVNFIVVSGYKYFDYAYNALKYGVEDYLLKPIQKEELNTILSKITLARREKELIHQKQSDMENELESSQRILQQSFFRMLLNSGEEKAYDRESLNQEFHLELSEGKFLCYAIIVDGDSFDQTEIDNLCAFSNTLYKKVKEFISRYDECRNFMDISQVWIHGILNYQEAGLGNRILEDCFESVQKFTQNFYGYSVTFSTGREENHCNCLKREMKQTTENLGARLSMGVNTILKYDRIEEGRTIDEELLIPEQDYSGLRHAIASEKMDEVSFQLKELFRRINGVKDLNFRQYYYAVFRMIHVSYEVLGAGHEMQDIEERLCRKVSQIYLKSDIRNYVIHSLTDSIEGFYLTRKQRETKPVRLVKEYLEQHYAEPVGLEEAAAMVNLNPVYLSVLFKRSTGTNFNDYLTGIRVDAAKRLLMDTNISVSDIAGQVGYGNGKYFSQVFSKVVGLNPTVYRKLHS